MWEAGSESSHSDAPRLRLAHSSDSLDAVFLNADYSEPELLSEQVCEQDIDSSLQSVQSLRQENPQENQENTARGAQRLMQGIFDLGYGKAGLSDRSWMEDALCAQTDPDIFYPEKGGSTAPATSVCNNCLVREECLEYAVTNDIRHGIWGGTSDNDRKRMARERKLGCGSHIGSL